MSTTSTVRDRALPEPRIDGVVLRELKVHKDQRGSFTEFFSQSWAGTIPPAQWSVVRSHPGTLRGMHLHRRHHEGFLLISGRASVGLRDIRPGSPTEGVSVLLEFSEDKPVYLTFPFGIVHGWLFHEPSMHLQSVTETYGAYSEDDNFGCHWSDPALEIAWPAKPIVVSPRADSFGSLAELLERTLQVDSNFCYERPGSKGRK